MSLGGWNKQCCKSVSPGEGKSPALHCAARPLRSSQFQTLCEGRRHGENVMSKKATTAVVALLGGALMLSTQEALARDWDDGLSAKGAAYSLSRIRTRGWIQLHRVDGEITHINVDQILYVTNAKNTGGNERAKSRVQLVNGFSDVLETVDEVMQSIKNNDALAVEAGG